MCNTKTHINIGMRTKLNISVVETSLVETVTLAAMTEETSC